MIQNQPLKKWSHENKEVKVLEHLKFLEIYICDKCGCDCFKQ